VIGSEYTNHAGRKAVPVQELVNPAGGHVNPHHLDLFPQSAGQASRL